MADMTQHSARGTMCEACYNWQGAIEISTGTIGRYFGCIKAIPEAGALLRCRMYEPDPLRLAQRMHRECMHP